MTVEERYKKNYEKELIKFHNLIKELPDKIREAVKADAADEQLYNLMYQYGFAGEKIEEVKKNYKFNLEALPKCLEEMDAIEHWAYNMFGDDIDLMSNQDIGEISFLVPCKRLSTIVIALADKFKWKPVTFGFASSFTTHEAITSFGKFIHVGIDPTNKDKVLIEYHFPKEGEE